MSPSPLAVLVAAAVLACALAPCPAQAVEVTAITLFLCDDRGVVNAAGRWNTGPIDAAWDLFVREGGALPSGTIDPAKVRWLNGRDHTVKIPLAEGTRTFAIHFDGDAPLPIAGINLFLDSRNDRPAISAFTRATSAGAAAPEPRANGASPTMGWPITDVPGAGTLTHEEEAGLWSDRVEDEAWRVALAGFRVIEPQAGGLDLVGPHAAGPSGRPDGVAQLTLAVERRVPRPAEPILWLRTAGGVTGGDPARAGELARRFGTGAAAPFSFSLGGVPSRDLLGRWERKAGSRDLGGGRTARTLAHLDPATGLEVRWEAVEHADFPAVEWTLHLKNTGSADTPLLSEILALAADLRRRPGDEYLLRHWKGTFVRRDDYEPLQTVLEPGAKLRLAPPGGRPCGQVFPYFNLEAGGEGLIIAVSWAGQWACELQRDAERGLRVTAGQETTRLVLRPGEEIRTPMIVLLPWKGGDWIDAQNLWRRWMVRHNLPRPGGKLPPVPQLAACSSHQFGEMIHADEASQKVFIDRYLEEGLKLDYWWMDAGWFVQERGWPQTGTWEVDRKRFPRGLRAVSDHAKAKGVRTIVWFEPERVAADTWLSREHPEWIIGGSGGGLLDLGNREAWTWLSDHADKLIRDEGIGLYRQDFNMDPIGHWRSKDAPDRQGMTENRHVTGYLAYWDELRRRHPDLLIDSCASGGHRNDLETLRRAVPLLRSDYIFEPVGQQCHTYGLASWFPFHGTAVSPPGAYDPYTYRSHMCPHNTGCFDVRRKDLDYESIRRLDREWRRVAPFYLGDYYPLTPYSSADDAWMAWQFHDPGSDAGVVQAFRRSRSPFFGVQLRLRGLAADAEYELEDMDAPGTRRAKGRELLEQGLRVAIEERPGARTVLYRAVVPAAR
ncbi:MAG: alpha-galactosidase [Planctomycetes bacterium]|nr:alpha-galactosidase [Planctomycetota bacterium]